MPFASGANSRISYVAEVTQGTTPSTPSMKAMRVTGGGLRTTKATDKSSELRGSRDVTDEIMLGQDVAGSYPFELSYAAFDDFLAAALFGTWVTGTGDTAPATNTLKNGKARHSFTIEEGITVGGTEYFSRFTGCMVSTLSLDISSRRPITGTLGMMGLKETTAATALDASVDAAAANAPMTASRSVSALTVAGSSYKVRRMTIDINNNMRTRPLVGSLYSDELGEGDFDCTGTIEVYFENNTLHQLVLDHGGGALAATLGHDAGQRYVFSMPNIVFLDGGRTIAGKNDDVIVALPYRAKLDATLGATLQIQRAR